VNAPGSAANTTNAGDDPDPETPTHPAADHGQRTS
jgi:hypothetical protein